MPSVRNHLESGLGLRPGSLNISFYPSGTNWKHTYWWREGDAEYAKAQFFAQIAHDYPVLSLGVAIEKGYEGGPDTAKPPQLMDRREWDWPRLVKHIDAILSTDVPAIARSLGGPVHLRVTSKSVLNGSDNGWHTRSFSFVEPSWFERYEGSVKKLAIISEYITTLDGQLKSWAIVHFARDLGPAEAEGLSPSQVAATLLAFDGLRQRLRDSLEPERIAV